MRRSVFVFLSAVLLSLLVVPVINILAAPNRDAIKWRQKSFLYNMDFASRWAARLLYPFGISTDPKQVIIGRDNWLFLGDYYEQTRTVDRRPPTEADFTIGKQIGVTIEAWDVYLASKGVRLFRVMIAPNKGVIYPEHLPFWAKPASPNATDALLAGTSIRNYVDLRESLLLAKPTYPEALYYKTDTHWNFLGAGIAFRTFAQRISKDAPEIKWLPDAAFAIRGTAPRTGGDLASFLRLTASLTDLEPQINALDLSVETTQFDFNTNQVLHQGGNPLVGSPTKPLLVVSKGALNEKKVLWLRDSFGTAMAPLVAATFSHVVQLHYSAATLPGGELVRLVEEWKPDYVFITVVERASRASSTFAVYPPPVLIQRGGDFKPTRTTIAVAANHLKKGSSENEHEINGNDPFVVFALSDVVTPSEIRYLSIDLTCDDGTQSVPLQLFWLEGGRSEFDEQHSASFSFRTGQNLIDLRTIPKWLTARAISRIRLDIDPKNSCTHFKLNNPTLGLNDAKS